MFAECDHIFEDQFKSPVQHNTLAEFHVALADFSNPDKLHMWTPTQGAPMYKMQLAEAFGLKESQVRIVYQNVGGAFTGRGRAKAASPDRRIAVTQGRQAGEDQGDRR